MIGNVELPLPLRVQLRAEAIRAFPRECCGLIEGVRDGSLARVLALHPTPNIAIEMDRFEIDPALHIALLRGLRGTGRAIIGCYHSHPNGRTEPSARDRECATEDDFLWLICSLNARTQETGIAAFRGMGGDLPSLPIVNLPEATGSRPTAARSPAFHSKARLID